MPIFKNQYYYSNIEVAIDTDRSVSIASPYHPTNIKFPICCLAFNPH